MRARLVAAMLIFGFAGAHGFAATIIDEWSDVKVPPPPELKSVALDPKTSALLLLDFNGGADASSGPCNAATKPRCLASIPKIKALLDKARAAGVFVVYSLSSNGNAGDIQPDIAPVANEAVVKSGPDKFIQTDLRDLLAFRNVKTVVVTGTASEGAVLDTATDAALHGLNIVVPVDGMSSTELYGEQYVAWHLTHAPGVAAKTTLTRSDMIGF